MDKPTVKQAALDLGVSTKAVRWHIVKCEIPAKISQIIENAVATAVAAQVEPLKKEIQRLLKGLAKPLPTAAGHKSLGSFNR